MFPTTDFNFVVAGIATFAATVGYACSRRLSSSSPSSLPASDSIRDSIMRDAKFEDDVLSSTSTAVEIEEVSNATSNETSIIVTDKVMQSATETAATEHELRAVEVEQHAMVVEPAPASAHVPASALGMGVAPVVAAAQSHAPTRKASLKRKAPDDGFEETREEKLGYPFNLANIYPNKRSKTPTSERSRSNSPAPAAAARPADPESALVTPAPVEVEAQVDDAVEATPAPDREVSIEATPVPEREQRAPSPEAVVLAVPEPTPPPAVTPQEIESTPAPPPLLAAPVLVFKGPKVTQPSTVTEVSSAPFPFLASPTPNPFASYANKSPFASPSATRPATPKSSFTSPSRGGFASFAGSGSGSPFASFSKSPEQPSFSRASSQRSIWSANDITSHQNEDPAETFLNDVLSGETEKNNAIEGSRKEVSVAGAQLPEKYTPVTGEEGEVVEQELKGLRLFVKRGTNAFSEGIFGHIKLLSNLETQEQRLLFRREPLLKVSMNVRLQPTLRATFVPEENVLRFILKETIEGSETESKQQVVIYAVKPGKSCNKQDFKNFAERIMENENLKAPSKIRSA